jgi:hypothetical protein
LNNFLKVGLVTLGIIAITMIVYGTVKILDAISTIITLKLFLGV